MTEATDGREAYRLAHEHKPDIVLLDVDMLDLDVESVTKLIHQHLPDTKVLLLARYDEDTRIVAAMQAGAFGYILKDTDQTDFLHIIRATARSEHVLSPIMPDRLVHNAPGSLRPAHEGNVMRLSPLSDREHPNTVFCRSRPKQQRDCRSLVRLRDTVKTHLHHIYQKLSVDGRVEAVIVFLRA